MTRLRLFRALPSLLAAAAIFAPGCDREKKPDARAELEKRRSSILQRLDRIAAEQTPPAGASRVVITAVGDRPEAVGAVLREQSGAGGAPSPGTVASGISGDEAQALAARLRAAGATVEVLTDPPADSTPPAVPPAAPTPAPAPATGGPKPQSP